MLPWRVLPIRSLEQFEQRGVVLQFDENLVPGG